MKDGTAEFDIKKIASTESVDAKLDTKQDVVEDTGWIEVTEIGSNFSVRNQYYTPVVRRIGKKVFFKGQFDNKKHTSNNTTDQNFVCRIPEGFRAKYEVTVDTYLGSWINSVGSLSCIAVYPTVEWLQFNTSWFID